MKHFLHTSGDILTQSKNRGLLIATLLIVLSLPVLLILLTSNTDRRSHAASTTTFEAEDAVTSGNIQIIADATASNAKAVIFGGSGITPTLQPTPTITPSATGAIKSVIVMMVENTDWASVKGNTTEYPYINSLLPQAAWANDYVTPYHPSLPNYLALEAASDMGDNGNGWNMPGSPAIPTTDHLTTYLNKASISWKFYGENLPGNGTECPTTDPGKPYSADHNPFTYFDDVRNNTSYCIAHERPYSEFLTDLANNTLPKYSFITPNDYDQGEHIAPNSTCGNCQADTFLSQQVPKILSSQALKNNGALFIVWDEPDMSASNPSGMIVLSPLAKKNYGSNVPFQGHASFVRTMEEIFNVRPFIRDAATATDFQDLFTVPLQ